MIASRSTRRLGITLTEILIAILIMGVGLISLATLFPLGLLRLREASRLGRSALEARVATDDTDARALLYKPSFRNTWYGLRDPFVQDTDSTGAWYNNTNPLGIGALASGSLFYPHNNLGYDIGGDGYTGISNLTSGLPFCYDPLWRSLTGVVPGNGLYDPTLAVLDTGYTSPYTFARNEARFGSGVFGGTTPYLRADGSGIASAHGIQRLTNFIPWASPTSASVFSTSGNLNSQYNFTCANLYLGTAQPPDVAGNVFTNVDDIVFNPLATNASAPSSLIPDMTTGGTQNDYRFSWFFTGQQADAGGNGSQFVGNIVVCENRPFSFDPLPGSATSFAPGGETVVEAIYGYGGNAKSVLLRWKSTLPDPPLRVGGWFADTTYERSVATYRLRTADTLTPYARCYWYQIAKRTDPTIDATDTTCRSAVVTLTAPVRVKTPTSPPTAATETSPANQNYGSPLHVNVALIMPSVVNVFPRSFEVH